MRFLTFQPYDWRETTVDKAINRYLGFDAVYCVNADYMDIAFINAFLITPSIPETAIYFETEDFYMIDKVEQEKSVIFTEKCDLGVASAESYKEIAGEWNISLKKYINTYYPYKFEYLVDKRRIREKVIIDICDRVSKSFGDSDQGKKNDLDDSIMDFQMNSWEFKKNNPEKFKNIDDVVLLRGVTAHKYLNSYRYNELFFEDYKKLFKIRKKDTLISGKRIHDNKEAVYELQCNYYNNPSDHTLNRFCSFLNDIITKT